MNESDEKLFERSLQGDDRPLRTLMERHGDALMLYLNGYVSDRDLAEELAEDTFVRLFTKKPKNKGGASFKTWLYTIGRNMALNYLKKKAKYPTVPIENTPELISDEAAVEDAYIKKEQKIAVHRAMRKLKPEYQQVLWLIYFEGLSNKEAAKVMKKSVRSTESILYRAKKSLRSQLEMEGIDYEKT